jgi:hypothetical protein
MIHYHGGPVTPTSAAITLWTARHACVSYAYPDQLAIAASVCQSFILDNGAFTAWTQGRVFDFDGYVAMVKEWQHHPSLDWCLIPDVIDGTETDNEAMIAAWHQAGIPNGVPVWHLHESLDWLSHLADRYPRIALGSSGAFATIGTSAWWQRMEQAMRVVCDDHGRPRCKLHGLRMLDPQVFGRIPLASADSTNVARNVGIDKKWRGTYAPMSADTRALVIAERIERSAAADCWVPTHGLELELSL